MDLRKIFFQGLEESTNLLLQPAVKNTAPGLQIGFDALCILQINLKPFTMNEIDVIIIGSCNVDHITYTPQFPKPGETLHGTRYVNGLGGKGANQCVAARKLGANAAMVGKVGFDNDGDSFINQFHSLNIDTKFLTRTKSAATGIATIIVDESGCNSIVIVTGANMCLEPSDVRAARSAVEKAKIVVCQNEIELESTLEALKTAKSCGKFTMFNPAPAPLHDLSKEFYELSDIICCNETEAYALTGITTDTVANAEIAAQKLVEKGAEIALVTLGENGCVLLEKGTKKAVHVKTPQVNAIDTTGAGDCFVGALGFFLANYPDLSLAQKVDRACRIASYSVCKGGTQSSFPSRSDLPEILFSNS